MHAQIPSIEDVREALDHLNLKQLEALAQASGVPFTTLYKIKLETTVNPGIETVRKFLPHIPPKPPPLPQLPPSAQTEPAQEGA